MSSSMRAIPQIAVLVLGLVGQGLAQGGATPKEVVEKVHQAAKALSQSGEAGLSQFNQKDGPWVWKDSYIFVLDCTKKVIAAHPVRPDLIGQDALDLKGTRGKKFFAEMCQATKNPSGVWVEYYWPKPGMKEGSRKVSYTEKAGNTAYVVGAGVYDDKATIADLQKLTNPKK